MVSDENALVPARAAANPGSVEIAADINAARADQLVALDGDGNVTSMRRLLWRSLPVAAIAGAGLGSLLALSTAFGGVLALPVVMTVAGGWLVYVRGASRIRRSAEAIARDDLVSAGDQVTQFQSSWMPFPSLRGYAAGHAGAIAWRRGNLREALSHTERAIAQLAPGRWRRAGPVYWMQTLNRAQLLAALDRLEEAEAQYEQSRRAPPGNWVEMERAFTELFLAFCRDDATRLPEDLHPWARAALQTNVFGGNLVLLAWAYERRGDPDMAAHLLEESTTRLERWHLDRTFPAVWRWVQGAQVRLARGRDA